MSGPAEKGTGAALLDLLEASRRAEKEQALLYRSLAALAEEAEDAELAQRFHDLHADEQHHLSRLTARLLELGEQPPDLSEVRIQPPRLAEWEALVPEREAREVARYRALLDTELDDVTRPLIVEILEVEERHASELGGKWTMA